MPVTTFNFSSGINKDDSPLASEGGWIDGNLTRFSAGRAQSIGGWDYTILDQFSGIVRGAHAWSDLVGQRYLAFGTAATLYVVIGGLLFDITPPHSEGVIANPFTTSSGSAAVTVSHPTHALLTGMSITFSHTTGTVGGLALDGTYVITVIDDDSYTITAASNATSSATGGGYVDYTAALNAGLVDGLGEPGGYGGGPYGFGGYGSTLAEDSLPRLWFLDNWGETLVALPRGGALYQYQPSLTTPELITNGDFSSSAGYTLGTGWSVGAGVATAVAGTASDLSRAVLLRPGMVYRVRVDVTVSAGGLTMQSNVGSFGDSSGPITASGSYSRLFRAPAGATDIVFSKNSTFAGSVDNISIKLENLAYRINEAPARSNAMFVDPHQIVVLLGTSPFGEAYAPMSVRWCDRQNIDDWTPTTVNLAGDDILAQGSRLMSGIATRQQNLIWSNSTLFTMQYTGDATQPFLFNIAGSGCGIIGGLARVEHDGVVYWASRDNFYQYVGTTPVPVPCTMRRDVFEHISQNQGEKVFCGIIPAYSEVLFTYPDSRDGTECSRTIAIRWDEGHTTGWMFNRTAWVNPGIYEYPIAFSTDGYIFYHEKGNTAAGGVLSWFIESAYFDIGDGENLTFLRRIIPDFEDLLGPVTITIYGKSLPSAPEKNYGTLTYTTAKQKLDMRVLARQIKLRFSGASSPAFARFGALRLDLMPSGDRR